jgi:polysaccharide export outer membrane protein
MLLKPLLTISGQCFGRVYAWVSLVMSRRLASLALAVAMTAGACAPRYAPSDYALAQPSGPYRLASGDRLRIIVFGQDNLSNIYAVDGSGRISMPLIDTVEAQGRTTQQLEKAIESKLRGGFLREPKVSVEVDTYRPFFVLGEVTNSGQFPYVNGMTVQTAVAIAGGFTPRGQRAYAEVTRQVEDQLVTASVPITYPVQPGDTIVIKERWF